MSKKLQMPSVRLSEMAVIKNVTVNPDLYDSINLDPSDFSDRESALAWKAIQLNRKSDKLALNFTYLADVLNKIDGVNHNVFIAELRTMTALEKDLEEHVKSIKSASFGRGLIDIIPDIDKIAKSGVSPDEMATLIGDILYTKQSLIDDTGDNVSDLDEFESHMRKVYENPGETDERVPTFYPILDRAFNGGFPVGYHVLAALPSVGKTTFSLQMAVQMALRGYKVFFASQEMTRKQLFTQVLTIMLGVNRVKVETQSLNDFEYRLYQKALEVLRSLLSSNLKLDFKERHTPQSFEAALNKAKREMGKVDVSFVDYIQYMDPPEAKGGRYFSEGEKFSEISKSLRDIAKKHNIVLIGLSQFNRTIEQGEVPKFTALAGSSQIERDVGVAALMYVKKDRSQFTGAAKEIIGIEIAKGRTEGRHSLEFELIPSQTRFNTNFDFFRLSNEREKFKLNFSDISRGTVLDEKDNSIERASSRISKYEDSAIEFDGFFGE